MTRRITLTLLALCGFAGAFLLTGFGGRAGADPVLNADVGLNDAFVISLKDSSGAAVTHLDPGTYSIVVNDRSEIHDFHLRGPGVDVATGISEVGTITWSVTLRDGTYTFVCDPHDTVMKGAFGVGSAPAPTTTTTTGGGGGGGGGGGASGAKVAGRVGPGATIGVNGAARLKAGRAVFTIADRSSVDNFHLVGPGVNKRTGVAFKGVSKWSLTLRPGTYTFRSDAHAALHGKFRVTAKG
jgi:hypothetical protein